MKSSWRWRSPTKIPIFWLLIYVCLLALYMFISFFCRWFVLYQKVFTSMLIWCLQAVCNKEKNNLDTANNAFPTLNFGLLLASNDHFSITYFRYILWYFATKFILVSFIIALPWWWMAVKLNSLWCQIKFHRKFSLNESDVSEISSGWAIYNK